MKTALFIFTLLFTVSANAQFLGLFGKKKAEPEPETINQVVQNGTVLTVAVSSADFVTVDNVRSIEAARKACFESQKATPGLSDTVGGMEQMRLALTAPDCGKGYADALIAVENRKLGQTQARWGGFYDTAQTLAGIGGKAYAAGKLIDGGVDVFNNAVSRAGAQVTVDNGSTVTGAVGEGNTYTATEQVSGILTQPAPVSPIAFGSEAANVACLDVRAVLATDPAGIDGNGDGLVCSDNAGGVRDNV